MAVAVRFPSGTLRLENGGWGPVAGEAAPPAHFVAFLNSELRTIDALPMGYYPDPEMAIARAVAGELHGTVLNPERQAPHHNDPPDMIY